MAREYSLRDAKARLSELIDQAARGEDIVITRRGRPVARLSSVAAPRRQSGALRGRIRMAPDFNETTPEMIELFEQDGS